VKISFILLVLVVASLHSEAQNPVPPGFQGVSATWKASPIISSCGGFTDTLGRAWTDPAFDDSTWSAITPPDAGSFNTPGLGPADRFYRGSFNVSSTAQPVFLFFVSDDSIEIFVNGTSIGSFSPFAPSICHQLGCVNIPGCGPGFNVDVPPVQVPANLLRQGMNLVAAHVSNGGGGSYFDMAVLTANSSGLSDRAAARALSLKAANLRYGYGGKGYDFNPRVSLQQYVTPTVMADPGYWYRNCNVTTETCAATPIYKFATGIDCSGLVMWSYNTAAGATTLFQDSNPIQYPGADSQFLYNSTPLPPGSDLRPGDLLFFGTAARKTHVAMYIGGSDAANDVIESTLRIENGVTIDGVVTTSKTEAMSRPSFQAFRRPIEFAHVEAKARLFSPATLILTDPDGLTISADTLSFTDEEVLREVPGQLYYIEETGFDDEVIVPTLKIGAYLIKVVPKPNAAASETYSLTFDTIIGNVALAKDVPIAEIPSQGYGIMATGTAITPFIPIAIDIKPGNTPNSVNLKSNGNVPVAILSNQTFDAATQVDQTSLTFGHSGDEASLASCHTEDVNSDGLVDLLCHFNTQSTGFLSGDTVGVLKGKTIDGTPVRGTDSVNIVPK
jgi:cell wall-associated NlpC family hydrolase